MAKAAMKKILGHLWYLPEELEYFAFFDDELSVQDKKNVVDALIEGVEETIDEEQKQYLLLSVKEYRKKYPDFVI